MSHFLINPFMFGTAPVGLTNLYSLKYTRSTTPANMSRLYINNKTNNIDAALRDTTPNFSISFWFKPNTSNNGTTRILFSKYDNFAGNDRCFEINLNTSNQLNVYGQYDTINSSVILTTTATFATSVWTHVCFVYDCTQTTQATIAKLYVNGVETTAWATQTVSTTNKRFYNQTTSASRAFITFGCDYAGASANLPATNYGGQIDEMTFWNISLSSAEVTEMYNSGAAYDISLMTNYSANCYAWWRMGDYASDNWDGSKWNIINAKADSTMDLIGANIAQADRLTDAP